MISLPGYLITEKLSEGADSFIYRAYHEANPERVIIKVLKNEQPSPEELAHFRHEAELLQSLQGNGTVAVKTIEQRENHLFLVLEEFGTASLLELLAQRSLSISEFLLLALRITEALEKIHQHKIINKDINPSNILWDDQTSQAKIIDLGAATTLPREIAEINNPQLLQGGTLFYISPEQTGRMNRGIDYRTDYYSLGVTFYQMITGKLPFSSDDLGELIHAHIAKLPAAPHQINSAIPPVVSDIIMKLLAKKVEDRYQSTYGLKADLQTCLEQLQTTGKIESFPLGKKDISSRFQISEKLYGREGELRLLFDACYRTAKGQAELLLVTGYPGIGKSVLVHELYKPLLEKKGYFISGKFDPFKRNIPYTALSQAMEKMVRQILMENELQISSWRNRIQKAVGSNGQIAIDMVPLLATIIGDQPPVATLGPTETQHRFNLVFQHLIQAFASPEHPLVIFLDDCQWADIPSIQLLEMLLSHHESRHFLIILAYRENEVEEGHVLMLALNRLKKVGLNFAPIILTPLQINDIEALLGDTLHQSQTEVAALAEICHQKTGGNPFFLTQFLKTLYEKGLIEYNLTEGKWIWSLEKIRAREVTDNVLEFMAEKIKELPNETQRILQIAASLGNRFDLQTLAMITGQSIQQITHQLWAALQAGFILTQDTTYLPHTVFHFLHDHIQYAAYFSIPTEERKPIHLKIGRLLLEHTLPDALNENVLDIVNQLNLAIDLVVDEKEKQQFAELNRMAGEKALLSIAYKPALTYFMTGISLLNTHPWKTQYELTLKLYTGAVEAAYLATEPEEMNKYAEIAIRNIENILDKIKIYETQLHYLASQNRFIEAAKLAIDVINLLGVNFPQRPTNFRILVEFIRVNWLMSRKTIAKLDRLPDMTSPYYLAAMRILIQLGYVAYFIDRKLTLLTILYTTKLSVEHGNCAESANAYLGWAFMQCHVFNNFEKGYAFSQFALQLAERFRSDKVKVQVQYLYAHTILHWYEHVDKTLTLLLTIYHKALETGNIEYAGYCIVDYSYRTFLSGKELNNAAKEIKNYANALSSMGLKWPHLNVMSTLQVIFNLLADCEKIELVGEAFDERSILPVLIAEKDNIGIFAIYHNKLLLSYLFHQYELAYHYLLEAKKNDDKMKSRGHFAVPAFCFITSLVYLRRCRSVPKPEKRQLLKAVKKNQALMKRWAYYAPMNYSQKYYLVEAELAYTNGQLDQAATYYDQAIQLAKQNRYLHEEAIANELAALFYFAQGKEKIAKVYLSDAHYCYVKWGAVAKVKHLEKNYPQLLTSKAKYGEKLALIPMDRSPSPLSANIAETVDLASIMKSAQTISSEIILADLLKKMMRIVIENAGAQKGFLLLEKLDEWLIEAEGSSETETVTVLQHAPIEPTLPASIIHYVMRTRTPLALDDASHTEQFASDPYIQRLQPKSVLCTPLINQGTLSGILYLENNLATEVFTPNRIQIINLLSGQIIVAIDNARLYSHLKELNQAYECFVPKEFLNLLEKKNIIEVHLGDQVQKEMTVMFCDIRGFTTLSEKMTPQETLEFINGFLKIMEPVITKHNGIIDKYIGDAIMALFPLNADDAVRGAIAMVKQLDEYNKERKQQALAPIRIGIGLNTGKLVLGTVGDEHRMEGTVISDAVNIASRVESLTKLYGASIIITKNTYTKLKRPDAYTIRILDKVVVKGKSKPTTIYEIFENDPEALFILKQKSLKQFEEGVLLFKKKKYSEALLIFQTITHNNPDDIAAQSYLHRCQKKLRSSTIT